MTGTRAVLAVQWRAQRRRLLVWVVATVGTLAFTAIAVAQLYNTPEEIASYGQAVVSDALVAINGHVEGIDTLGGIIQDEFGFIASFLMPLIGLALIAGMTRGEEESGRLEALLAGRIDRRAPVVSALALVVAAVVVMDLGFVLSLLVAGIELGPAVLYALALGMVTVVFAALGAVCGQVVLHSRGVFALGFTALGLSYVLRGVGDVNGTFWVWLSPLGWLEKTAPFADEQRWWVLLVPILVATALSVVAVVLAGRRDLGAALYRQGPGEPSATPWLVRPLGLALHGQRGSFLGWLVGSVALAAVMGALAQEVVGAIVGNPSVSKAMGITQQNAADGFLASTQVYLAIIACGYVVQSLGLLRREEAEGRLEPVLAGAWGRVRWLGAQVLVVTTGLVVVVVVSAVVFGAATSLSTGDSGYVATLLKSGLAYLPAELVIAAVAVLLYGFIPRAFALAWAAFGVVTFIGLLGSGLQLPAWVLNLSPLTHVGKPPVDAIDTTALAWLVTGGGPSGFSGVRRFPAAPGTSGLSGSEGTSAAPAACSLVPTSPRLVGERRWVTTRLSLDPWSRWLSRVLICGDLGPRLSGQAGPLVCPAFPLRWFSGRAWCGGWTGQAGRGGPVAGVNTLFQSAGPLVGPGPVRGQVEHGAALRPGQPGGNVDDLAAQGRAAGDGMRCRWSGCRRRAAGCG